MEINNNKSNCEPNNEERLNYHYESYISHSQTYLDSEIDREYLIYRDWFSNGTVDVWRHERMLRHIDVLLEAYPNANWLAIADGRWGTAARYIERKGGIALATDLDDRLLKIAVERGILRRCKNENAENLSFHDSEFDFAYCKEAFHHFPRAYIAIYEMLRVSKIAVIVTEPRDWLPAPFSRRVIQLVKNSLKKALNIEIPHPDSGNYEPIGNYVFTVSEREIQKIALGLHLPTVAFKNLQDAYIEGVENESISTNGPLFRRLKLSIFYNQVLQFIGVQKTNRITAIIFKTTIPEGLRNKLRTTGFTIVDLPRSPFSRLI